MNALFSSSSLSLVLPKIQAIDDSILQESLQDLIDHKTKPMGSLGVLESLASQVGLIQRTTGPHIQQPTIIVFAGDHGVVAENISSFPQSVTWQMVENFLHHGAAINVFARQNQCALHVVDAGVKHDFGERAGLINRKIAYGTENFLKQPAMSEEECVRAVEAGMALVAELDTNVIGFGEMGIGNTTSAAAIMHKITGIAVAECVGPGTGLDADGVRHKQHVIEAAVALHKGTILPADILRTFGGFEIAMIAGAMVKAAERRMILLIDGFIVTSALLVAAQWQPAILDYCVFSHCSNENGHQRMLQYLGGEPLLQLGLRLGEGTGSALALPLLHSAVNFLNEMATFSSAQVSDKSDKVVD